MEQMATIKRVVVATDKDNNMLASVLITFPIMNDTDRDNVFKLIELQNEEVIFSCFSRQLSFIGETNEHGYKD